MFTFASLVVSSALLVGNPAIVPGASDNSFLEDRPVILAQANMNKDKMMKGDAMKKDAMMKSDGMKKDAMMKDGDAMKKDAMAKKDGMMKETSMKKDAMMKGDAMKDGMSKKAMEK